MDENPREVEPGSSAYCVCTCSTRIFHKGYPCSRQDLVMCQKRTISSTDHQGDSEKHFTATLEETVGCDGCNTNRQVESKSNGQFVPPLREICISLILVMSTQKLDDQPKSQVLQLDEGNKVANCVKEDTEEQNEASSHISTSPISKMSDEGNLDETLTYISTVSPTTKSDDDDKDSQDSRDANSRPVVEPFMSQHQEETFHLAICKVLSIAVMSRVLSLVWFSFLINVCFKDAEEEHADDHVEDSPKSDRDPVCTAPLESSAEEGGVRLQCKDRCVASTQWTMATDEGTHDGHSWLTGRRDKTDETQSSQDTDGRLSAPGNKSSRSVFSDIMNKSRKQVDSEERKESTENGAHEGTHKFLFISKNKREEMKYAVVPKESSSSADISKLDTRCKSPDARSDDKEEDAALSTFCSTSHITPQFRQWVVSMLRSHQTGGPGRDRQQTDFTSEWNRLITFHDFRVPPGIYILPIAQNGFFLRDGGSPESSTRVECAFCGVRVPILQFREARAEEVHRRASPSCRFVSGASGVDNVSISGLEVQPLGSPQSSSSPRGAFGSEGYTNTGNNLVSSASAVPFLSHQHHHHHQQQQQQQQQQTEALETDHCPELPAPPVNAASAAAAAVTDGASGSRMGGGQRPGADSVCTSASRAKVPRMNTDAPAPTPTPTAPTSAAPAPTSTTASPTANASAASSALGSSSASSSSSSSSAFSTATATTRSVAFGNSTSSPPSTAPTSTAVAPAATASATASASASAGGPNAGTGDESWSGIPPGGLGTWTERPLPSGGGRDEESMEVSPSGPPMVVASSSADDAASTAAAASAAASTATVNATASSRAAVEEDGIRREESGGGESGGGEGSSTNGTEENEQERQVVTYENLGIFTDRPKRPDMAVAQVRINTFGSWPHEATHPAARMAEAGFYYTGHQDLVRCFFCKGGLKTWEQSDQPWVEHCRWFPRCPFVRLAKGEKFVEVVRTINSSGTQPTISESQVVEEVTKMEEEERRSLPPAEPACKDPYTEVLSRAALRQDMDISEDTFAELEEQLEDEQDDILNVTLCKMCKTEEVNVLFLPCGHLVACAQCAPALRNCAMCRQPVKGAVRVIMDNNVTSSDHDPQQPGGAEERGATAGAS